MNTTSRIGMLVVSAVACQAIVATAQERRVFGMIGVGPAVPVGEFGDGFGTGWDLSVGVGLALANRPIEIRGQLSYGSFKESGGATGANGTSKPRALNADLLYRLGGNDAKVRPYLVGGLGFSSVKYSTSYNVPGGGGGGEGFSETDSGVSFGGGGGLTVQAGSVGVFAEARYTAIPGSGHSHLPIVVGVRLGRR